MATLEDTLRQIIREELAALRFGNGKPPPEDDELLTAGEAAKMLKVSRGYLYKYAETLPYAVRLNNNTIRFSRLKIQAEIRRKLQMQGKPSA